MLAFAERGGRKKCTALVSELSRHQNGVQIALPVDSMSALSFHRSMKCAEERGSRQRYEQAMRDFEAAVADSPEQRSMATAAGLATPPLTPGGLRA